MGVSGAGLYPGSFFGLRLVESIFAPPGHGWLAERTGCNDAFSSEYRLVRLDDPNLDLSNCNSLSVCPGDYARLKELCK
jgi:hypothetical protein